MNNLSHFNSNDLKSLIAYLEHCKRNLEKLNNIAPTEVLKQRLNDVKEELDDIHEELYSRCHGEDGED